MKAFMGMVDTGMACWVCRKALALRVADCMF